MRKHITLYCMFCLIAVFITRNIYSQDTWEQVFPTGDIPEAREGHTMNVIGDKVYLFGGWGDESRFNPFFYFLLELLEWHRILTSGESPQARGGHAALALDFMLLLFFGFDGINVFDDIWQYDPQTNTWSEINVNSVMRPAARYDHTATLIGDKVYLLGGQDSKGAQMNDLWVLDTKSLEWTMLSPIIGGSITGHTAIAKDGNIHVYGGVRNGPWLNTNVFTYDPKTDVWTSSVPGGSSMPSNNAAAAQLNGIVHLFGGCRGTHVGLNRKWDIGLQSFDLKSAGPERTLATATPFPPVRNGQYQQVLFFGGRNTDTLYNDTWIYTTDIELSAKQPELTENFLFFPNPASDFITINPGSARYNNCMIEIYSTDGRKVISESLSEKEKTLDVSGLKNGTYLISIISNGAVHSNKLVISR